MTEYIDKTEAMRRFKPFGREIPKEQVMAVLARIDEGIVRCKDCKYMTEHYDIDGNVPYWTCSEWDSGTDADGFCHHGERSEE